MLKTIILVIYLTIAHFFFLAQAKKEWKKQAQLYEAIVQEQTKQINILKSRLNDYNKGLIDRIFGKEETCA